MTQELTADELLKWALARTITDIGQFTPAQLRKLNSFVKKGWLSKGKGGPFPALKTVYAHPGFDFDADRQRHIDHAMYLAGLDKRAAEQRRNDAH